LTVSFDTRRHARLTLNSRRIDIPLAHVVCAKCHLCSSRELWGSGTRRRRHASVHQRTIAACGPPHSDARSVPTTVIIINYASRKRGRIIWTVWTATGQFSCPLPFARLYCSSLEGRSGRLRCSGSETVGSCSEHRCFEYLNSQGKGKGKVHLNSDAFVHLPSAALPSQTGPAFSLGRIRPRPSMCSRSLNCAATQPHVALLCRY